MVFSRTAGDARLFRSVDCWCCYAHDDHYRIDGDSLHRYQSLGQRVLHLETAQVFDFHFHVRVRDFVGCDDHYWDVHSGSGLAVVLAGTNLGPQPVDLRGKPRSTRSVWTHLERGESNFWRDRGGRILSGRRRRSVLTVPPENEKGFPTHEPAAVFAHG